MNRDMKQQQSATASLMKTRYRFLDIKRDCFMNQNQTNECDTTKKRKSF